jgi:peptidoglycan/xylan/chitin deacetylase (PgdA/CDA1 family)
MRAVLAYHSIDPSGSALSVSPASFREHVRWLSSGAVRVVSLAELLAGRDEEDMIAITFDDALESFGSVAAPLLLDAGLPVTVFVASDYVGKLADWDGTGGDVPVFPVLSWQELHDLSDAGVELGAHSRTHPVLTRLNDEQLHEEVHGSGVRIADRTGSQPRHFSYPYGAHDDRVAAAVTAGYDAAVTTELAGVHQGTDRYRLPRLEMYYFRDPRRLQAWGTAGFRRYLTIRRLARKTRATFRRRPW